MTSSADIKIRKAAAPVLTATRARELLKYDPETGALTWRTARSGVKVGALVGTITSEGYSQIEIDYRLYKAHRVIWLWMTGHWPKHQVDHINGMRRDNRWKNLREATPLQNSRNRRPSSRNKSGVLGVSWCGFRQKWLAYIGHDNRNIHLGAFTAIEDAAAARRDAERLLYGDFAPASADVRAA